MFVPMWIPVVFCLSSSALFFSGPGCSGPTSITLFQEHMSSSENGCVESGMKAHPLKTGEQLACLRVDVWTEPK